jgi:phosphoglycerol transferase
MSIAEPRPARGADRNPKTSSEHSQRRNRSAAFQPVANEAIVDESRPESFWAQAFRRHRSKLAAAAIYLVAAIITLVEISKLMHLSEADLHKPFAYGGDALMFQTWCNALVDHGWWLHNPLLGAPQTQSMEDFPQVDTLNFLIIRFFAFFTQDTQLVINLFCLATFVLPVLTGTFVMRRLGIASPVAIACSLLYSFLPYHFIRLGGHHFLTCYYVVPLSILLAVRVYQGRFLADRSADASADANSRGSMWAHWAGALGICLLQSSAGVYYAFFAMYFQAIAAVSASIQRRRLQPLLVAATLIAVTTAGVAANLAPTFMYWHRHGRNLEIANRAPIETEILGYKLAATLLPMPGHRIKDLDVYRNQYERQSINSNENMWSAQGVVANVGFLTLLGLFLFRKPVHQLLDGFSILNLYGILFATTGGLGMIFSFVICPMFRGQNRICVFLAFFSLAASGILLTLAWRRFGTTRARRCLMFGALVGLTPLAVLDQHPKGSRPCYELVYPHWNSDVEFVGAIERALPTGAMVYQLPYARFPEMPPVVNFTASDGIRFSLHSKTLRWSLGAVKGREADKWLNATFGLPVDQQIKTVAEAGFQGIQVNRKGYADNGAEIERQLREQLGVEPIVSKRGEETFFALGPYLAARSSESTLR